MTHLAQLIDRRLTALRMTRTQLADELGIVAVSVSRWLRPDGHEPIAWKHYTRLAKVLQVTIRDILAAAEQDNPRYVETYRHFTDGSVLDGQRRRR